MDVTRTARQLGISDRNVLSKAREFASLANVRVGALGQGEVCKAAVCLELAANMTGLSTDVTRDQYVKAGCCSAKVYKNTFTALQQALGVVRAVDLQQLVVKFGCASVRQSVVRVLALYKERFLKRLSDKDRVNASFNRPVFLATAFLLVARKNKIKVDQRALLEEMYVPRDDFLNISASMYELCFDVVGVEKTKKRAASRKTNTAVMDNHLEHASASDGDGDVAASPSGREPEAAQGAGPAAMPRAREPAEKKPSKTAPRQADYDEWKQLVLGTSAASVPTGKENVASGDGCASNAPVPGGAKHRTADESEQEGGARKKLKQAKLAFKPAALPSH